jgi:Family of unknown function (DUF6261)
MELYALTISRLHYLESGQFIIRFLTDFQSQNLDPNSDPEFKTLYDSLLAQSPVYDSALMQIRAKAESELLLSLDDNRDKKVSTLKKALNVFLYSDVPEEQAAFKLLRIVLKTYKDIESANFEAESLGLDNLVAELRTPTYSPAVATLGLAVHINNLEAANAAFKTTFNARSTATISTVVYDTKLLRKNILATYRDLAEYVHVMAKRKNTPFYNDTLTALNNGRKYFADIIARRSGTGETKSATA